MKQTLLPYVGVVSILTGAATAVASPCVTQSLGGRSSWSFTDHAFDDWRKSKDRPNEWSRRKAVDLGNGRRTIATYRATHAGNGTLRIKNLELRVWRAHVGEGFTYRPQALAVELSSKADSRACLLTVDGYVEVLDSTDETTGRKPVKLVYKFDPQHDAFARVSAKSPIALENIELSSGK